MIGYRMSLLLSILSGLLLIPIFPAGNIDMLAWFALIPLMHVINDKNAPWAALYAFVAGFTAYAGILYWIFPLVKSNTGSVIQSVACLVSLSMYLALFVAVWAGIVVFCRRQSLPVYMLIVGATWVALEYARTYLFTGFPWALIGYSQYRAFWLLPIVRDTGVYGVSFLVISVNALLYKLLLFRQTRNSLFTAFAIFSVLIALRFIGPIPSISPGVSSGQIVVGVIQPCIEQVKKWDKQFQNEILTTYESLADAISTLSPRFIVWPETIVPGFLPTDTYSTDWAISLVKRTKTANVIGTPYADPNGAFYNASVVVNKEGTALGVHRKTHLVPFGEFVPFRSILQPFFGILGMMGDFNRGTEYLPINIDSLKLGISICSENMFGDCARKLTKNGSTILINQTNDAWFFDTAAPEQHFVMNVFRAVENNRPVIVAGNTGVSGIISPQGLITKRTAVFTKTMFVAAVTPQTALTFYTAYGDVFAVSCCLIVLLFILWRIICLIKCKKS